MERKKKRVGEGHRGRQTDGEKERGAKRESEGEREGKKHRSGVYSPGAAPSHAYLRDPEPR